MKKSLLLAAVAALVISTQVAAQTNGDETIKEVLTNKKLTITWLGADFSNAKIEDFLGCEPSKFATEIVPAINAVVVQEPTKYDFAKFLLKGGFVNDIAAVTKSNEAINPDAMVRKDATPITLDESAIAKIVGAYDLSGKTGIGLVLIFESLSKAKLSAVMYLTYVKMPEGTVILSKRVVGKPAGFGVRNYWAGSIFNVLKDYEDLYHKKWKSEYGIK